jgi:hypothetical protein
LWADAKHEPSNKGGSLPFLPEASDSQMSCPSHSDVPTQTADYRDSRPMDCSPDLPSGAELTPGDVTAGQAADEVAGKPAASNAQDPMKRKSRVWKHYNKVPDYDETRLVKCCYCAKQYVSNNCSTGNMWKHVKKAHPDAIGIKPGTGSRDGAYSAEEFREVLVEWIVDCNLPFSVVDHPLFHKMVDVLNPVATVPSDDTVRRDIDRRLEDEKEDARDMLKDAPGRLSFAVDAWTSPNMYAFLGIVAHWTDVEWQPRNLLMDLPSIEGRHTGENLCDIFKKACDDLGMLPKLLAITTDNASSNNTFLECLGKECQRRNIPFNQESMRVRCIAHVINLAVQAFLGKLNSAALDCEDAYDEKYLANAKRGGFISRLRKLVVKVRESPQRRERFASQCDHDQVPHKELIVDVCTRWNSTHDMIERALELRKPLDSMAELNKDLCPYKLTANEWELLKSCRKFFKVFKTASDCLCAASYPTLAIAVPAYNFLIDKLEDYRDAPSSPGALKPAANAAIDKLKEYYQGAGTEVYAVATIMDPHFKLNYYHENEWEQEWIDQAWKAFSSAYARYRVPPAPDARERPPTELDGNVGDGDGGGGDDDDDDKVTGSMAYMYKRRRTAERDELKEYSG